MKKRTIIGSGVAAFVAAGAIGLGAYGVAGGEEAETIEAVPVADVADADVSQSSSLTQEAVLDVLDAAVAEAEKQDQRVTVAVVDRDGNTVGLIKMNGAGPQSEQSAQQKAYTAVAWNNNTSELSKNLKGNGPNIDDIPGTLFLPGGAPAAFDGVPVAGVGVAGAPDGMIDEAIAEAGLAALDD
ncbi:GlcG/HbpS family heme-binding protein [Salininema proteolyticum]|uniref:Heme-binding protein n=1 Tax=Salininema proteolyticum TaxID=1607685 RepID=A0ABV8TZR9_9ACTN